MTTSTNEPHTSDLDRIEQIKSLKHRYLRACDGKDPDLFRACFIKRGAIMDFGPLGKHDDADPVAEIFRQVALREEAGEFLILDMHHAFHPEITIIDKSHATGRWTLAFRQVDVSARTETIASMEYEDRYVVEDGEWKISHCISVPLWSLTQPLHESSVITQGRGLRR